MMSPQSFENYSTSVRSMNKPQLVNQIKNFKGNFELDFTDSYLKSCSIEKLRHILMAAVMTKS